MRDLLQSAVDQLEVRLRVIGPAEFQTLEAVEGSIDLKPFRNRFADEKVDDADFEAMTRELVKLVFAEAALR